MCKMFKEARYEGPCQGASSNARSQTLCSMCVLLYMRTVGYSKGRIPKLLHCCSASIHWQFLFNIKVISQAKLLHSGSFMKKRSLRLPRLLGWPLKGPHLSFYLWAFNTLFWGDAQKFDSQLRGRLPLSAARTFAYFEVLLSFYTSMLIKISTRDDYVGARCCLLAQQGQNFAAGVFIIFATDAVNVYLTWQNIHRVAFSNILQSKTRRKADCRPFAYSRQSSIAFRLLCKCFVERSCEEDSLIGNQSPQSMSQVH